MKMKLAVFNKSTGKIVRIHYLDDLYINLWGNKDFMTASNLDKNDYSQTIFSSGVNVDIINDTIEDLNLRKPDTSIVERLTSNRVQGIYDQNL